MYGKLHMSKRMNYIQDAALFCSKFTHLCEKFMALGLGGKTPLCGLFYIDYCGQSLVPSRAVFVKFHWGGVEVLAIEVDDRANAYVHRKSTPLAFF